MEYFLRIKFPSRPRFLALKKDLQSTLMEGQSHNFYLNATKSSFSDLSTFCFLWNLQNLIYSPYEEKYNTYGTTTLYG